MKTSNGLVLALACGALMLQGCAGTSGTRADAVQTAVTVPVRAAAVPASAPAPSSQAANVPESGGKPVVTANTKDNFEAVAAAIRQQMQPGGRFAFVSKDGRRQLDTSFADMRTLFDQYGSVDKMGPMAQGRLIADQNAINGVLARYDSNRRICWQEVPVGTHFPKMVCRTLGEIQNQRGQANHFMDENQRLNQQRLQNTLSPAKGGGH